MAILIFTLKQRFQSVTKQDLDDFYIAPCIFHNFVKVYTFYTIHFYFLSNCNYEFKSQHYWIFSRLQRPDFNIFRENHPTLSDLVDTYRLLHLIDSVTILIVSECWRVGG